MIASLARRFARNRRGNVAITFALAAVPVITLIGAAVDYSGAAGIHAQLKANADAAALMACRSTETDQAKLKSIAQTALNGFLPRFTPVALDAFASTNNPRTVSLTARVTYPTDFMKIVNKTSMSLSAETKCAAGENYFEIALVLDTTGSMDKSAGSKTKIAALRDSATSFVNTMFTNFGSGHVKVAIVPFAASVKVDTTAFSSTNLAKWLDTTGKSSIHWSNVVGAAGSGFTSRLGIYDKLKTYQSSWAWAGCVESRTYPNNTKDVAADVITPDTLYVPMFAPDEYGNSGSSDDNSANSYMDDGEDSADYGYTGSGSNRRYVWNPNGLCAKNTNPTSSTPKTDRIGQACKYKSPDNIRTSQDGPNSGCTSRAVTPLTNNQTKLTNVSTGEISKLTAEGSTNIHQGLVWGWNTLSPNGMFSLATTPAGGAAYGTPNTTKIIVLMTDGMNQWLTDSDIPVTGSYYSAYGYLKNADGTTVNSRLLTTDANPSSNSDTRTAIDNLTLATCKAARDKNVVIYTVAFSVSGDTMDDTGVKLLKDCAGDTANTTDKKAFLATDATSLNDTFVAIAKGIGALRITK